MYSRNAVVNLIKSWEGKNIYDGSYKEIIDIYNRQKNPPRGLKMQYDWAWCAATYSALAISLGYEEIMPVEISCELLIEKAKSMGIWKEDDSYIPKLGDAILYDWDDTGYGDCSGWADHIGTVIYVNEAAGYMTVMEGNYSKSVKKRTISLNGRYIRGFITPRFNIVGDAMPEPNQKSYETIAREVIIGIWGTGDERKKRLIDAGYNYSDIQSLVNNILNGSAARPLEPVQNQNQPINNRVTSTCSAKMFDASLKGCYKTTDNLYCRNDAGTNKKALCLIPKGTYVNCYGYYNFSNGVKWLYIQVTIDGVQYTGFSSIKYLSK